MQFLWIVALWSHFFKICQDISKSCPEFEFPNKNRYSNLTETTLRANHGQGKMAKTSTMESIFFSRAKEALIFLAGLLTTTCTVAHCRTGCDRSSVKNEFCQIKVPKKCIVFCLLIGKTSFLKLFFWHKACVTHEITETDNLGSPVSLRLGPVVKNC